MVGAFRRQLTNVASAAHQVCADDHQHCVKNEFLYYGKKADDLGKSAESQTLCLTLIGGSAIARIRNFFVIGGADVS